MLDYQRPEGARGRRDRRQELAVAVANAQRQRQGMLPPEGQDERQEFVRNAILRRVTGAQPQGQPGAAVPLSTATGPHYGHAGSLGERMDRLRADMGNGQGPMQADLLAERDRREALRALDEADRQDALMALSRTEQQADDPETARLRADAIARQAQMRAASGVNPQSGPLTLSPAELAELAPPTAPGARQGTVADMRAQDAELDRILTALRNAHEAGDTDAARRIARMAQDRMGGQPASAPGRTLHHPRAADLAAQGWANGALANAPAAPEPSRLRAAVRGAGDAITFGHLDELTAAGGAMLPGRTYEGEIARVRAMDEADREAHPVATVGGQVAGAIAGPGMIARGAGAAVSGGRQLARVTGLGAAQGGAYAAGSAEGDLGERAGAVPAGMGLGAAGGVVGAGIGSGFTRAAQALSRSPAGQAVAPTVEALRSSAQRLYEQVEQSGATIPANQVRALASSVRSRLTGDGYNARLHPRVAAVLDEIEGRSGPMTIREADILRRVATNAAQGTSPDEARLAMRAADAVDGMIDRLGEHSGPLREARAMWHTMRKSEAVEEAIERASTGPSSFAQNLQTEFRRLIRNKRAMRGFTDAERRAIAQVINGGAVEGTLRFLGKSMSPTGMMGAITSGGVALTGNIPAAAAMAATGGTSRLIADAMTRRSSQNALATVAGGDARQAVVEALLRQRNRNALTGVAPGAGMGGGYAGQMHSHGRGG